MNFHLSLPTAGITRVHHHVQLFQRMAKQRVFLGHDRAEKAIRVGIEEVTGLEFQSLSFSNDCLHFRIWFPSRFVLGQLFRGAGLQLRLPKYKCPEPLLPAAVPASWYAGVAAAAGLPDIVMLAVITCPPCAKCLTVNSSALTEEILWLFPLYRPWHWVKLRDQQLTWAIRKQTEESPLGRDCWLLLTWDYKEGKTL